MCCTPQDKSIGQPRQATEHKTLFHEQVPRRSICLDQVGMRWRVVRGVRGDLALLSQYAKQAPRGVLCEHKIDLGINVSQLHNVTRLAPHFTGKLHERNWRWYRRQPDGTGPVRRGIRSLKPMSRIWPSVSWSNIPHKHMKSSNLVHYFSKRGQIYVILFLFVLLPTNFC